MTMVKGTSWLSEPNLNDVQSYYGHVIHFTLAYSSSLQLFRYAET